MRTTVCLFPLLICGTADCFITTVGNHLLDSRKDRLRSTEATLPNPFHTTGATGDGENVDAANFCAHPAPDFAAPRQKILWIVAPAAFALLTAYPVEAADVVPSALWAYGHYLSMLLAMGSLVAERVLLQPQLSSDEEKALKVSNWLYVASLLSLMISGYERAFDFGKGFDFYSHEIMFWLKMSFVGVLLGCSLFPTITLYRRGSGAPPLSEKLARRMTAVVNAEISGVVTIPLLASFMSRGVTYANDFPWPVGVVLSVAATGGACYYYGSQALSWKEDA